LWKNKIPLKIKVWLWLIWHNAIATKDNLLKMNWTGDLFVNFAPHMKLFCIFSFSCPAAKYVWSLVGMAMGASTRPGSFAQFLVDATILSCKSQRPDRRHDCHLLGDLENA
jgi:hypothetical protein